MKKFSGWLLIVSCSIFLLVFAIAFIVIISGVFTKTSEVQMSITEILSSTIGFLLVISLLIFGLRKGISKVKKERVIQMVDYDKVLNIKLSGKIEYVGYRNLIMGLSFKKPIFMVLLGLMILFSLMFLVNSDKMMEELGSNYFVFIIIGIFLLSPILTLIEIKRLYKTNMIFHERLNYILDNDSINIKGNTVDSTQKWAHFYQIRETNNFFMLYHGKIVATLLDKKMFSESELQDFQSFIKSLNIKRI